MELKLSNTEKELLGLSIMDIVVNSERYNSAEKKCLEEIYHRMNREPHEAKAGGILKDPPQIKYYSERGFPLTTQFVYDWNDESNGMLTVENYNKWYRVYRITREGEVKPVGREELVESRLGLAWVDHAISPESFHLTAKKLGLEYDDRTFAMVCERFVTDYLEDWGRLARHLPAMDV